MTDADIFHEDAAPKSGTHGLAECFLGCETFCVCAGNGEGATARLGALDFREDPKFKAFAKALKRILDTLDIAKVRTHSDDHDPPRLISMPSSTTIIQCRMTCVLTR